MTARNREIAIVFDGPPGAKSGRFVEVEVDGASVSLGRWEHVNHFESSFDRWELRFTPADAERALGDPPVWLDHVYNGPAIRLPAEHDGQLGPAETISGAFHVAYRDERCAILANGEHGTGARRVEERGPGEGRWLVTMLDRLVKP